MRRDNVLGCKITEAMPQTDVTATTNGTGISRACTYSNKVVIMSGTLTAGTFTAKLQESTDDGATDAYSDVSAADTIAQTTEGLITPDVSSVSFVLTDDNVAKQLGYIGYKNWFRVVITAAAPSGTNDFVAFAEQGIDFANAQPEV